MVSFFKDKSAVSVFWLIIICCGLHVYSLINAPQLSVSANEGFFYYLLQPLSNLQPYTRSVLYVLIIFLTALQLNFAVNELNLLQKQSYTPALGFVLLSALLPSFNQITAALLSCSLFVWIIFGLCRLYNNKNAGTGIYNVGLLTGLSAILYYPMLPLIIAVLIGYAIIRGFNINEFFVLVFGLITPFYFLICYLFLKDNLSLLPLPNQLFNIYFDIRTLNVTPEVSIIISTLAVTIFIILWAIIVVKRNANRELIQVRNSWTILIILFILLLPVFFFMQNTWPSAMLVTFIPAACFIGFAFGSTSRSIFPIIFFWALVGFGIYNNWFAK